MRIYYTCRCKYNLLLRWTTGTAAAAQPPSRSSSRSRRCRHRAKSLTQVHKLRHAVQPHAVGVRLGRAAAQAHLCKRDMKECAAALPIWHTPRDPNGAIRSRCSCHSDAADVSRHTSGAVSSSKVAYFFALPHPLRRIRRTRPTKGYCWECWRRWNEASQLVEPGLSPKIRLPDLASLPAPMSPKPPLPPPPPGVPPPAPPMPSALLLRDTALPSEPEACEARASSPLCAAAATVSGHRLLWWS